MSRFCSARSAWTADRKPLLWILCAALAVFCAACQGPEETADAPDPISKAEAVALVNNLADRMRTVNARQCLFTSQDRQGTIVDQSYWVGSLVAQRGGKIRLHAYLWDNESKSVNTDWAIKSISDGALFWVERREPTGEAPVRVASGLANTTKPRRPGYYAFRPQEVARALCIDPIVINNFQAVVTVVTEPVTEDVPINFDPSLPREELEFEKKRVYYTTLTVSDLSGAPLRKIWIQPTTRKVRRQIYYDDERKPLSAIRYSHTWGLVDGAIIPLGYALYQGDKIERRLTFFVNLRRPDDVLRNGPVEESNFQYTPPEGIPVERVSP